MAKSVVAILVGMLLLLAAVLTLVVATHRVAAIENPLLRGPAIVAELALGVIVLVAAVRLTLRIYVAFFRNESDT